jgi:hypothetical protein
LLEQQEATFFLAVSYFRDWLENRNDLADQREAFELEIDKCLTAKARLEEIKCRYPNVFYIINKAELI